MLYVAVSRLPAAKRISGVKRKGVE